MKKNFSSLFLICLVVFALVSAFFVRIVPVYNSEISENIVLKNAENNFKFAFSSPKNSLFLGFDKQKIEENFSELDNFCVQFSLPEKNFYECLDVEHSDETGQYYTFPIVTTPTREVAFEIFYKNQKVDWNDVVLYSMNTLPVGKKLVFENISANAPVVSRADWGADETLRYKSHPRQIAAANARKLAAEKVKISSAAQMAAAKKTADINSFINSHLDGFKTVERITHENGHELLWPIQRMNKVNKIVIHHTADKINGRSDTELLRAIYSYHAVTRGWGDIGYNYIVGQNGAIYEGRAGGDYVVGAHASYNNIGSVGISVLGTYDKTSLNSAQENGMKSAIDMVVKKYNIDLNATVKGFYPCSVASCYPIKLVYTKALLGHRDVGVTSCPWNAIYSQLASWREEISRGFTPTMLPTSSFSGITIQPQIIPLQPKAIHDIQPVVQPIVPMLSPTIQSMNVNVQQLTTTVPTLSSTAVLGDVVERKVSSLEKNALAQTNYIAEKISIKLSYPKNFENIVLLPYADQWGIIVIDGNRESILPNTKVFIEKTVENNLSVKIGENTPKIAKQISFSAPVVEISSWTRKPEWDTKNRYNDNLFRDTIEVSVENNSLLVVNRLPLEYYLKGLGEVSDGDLPEKIKTITVAARGYAKFYMQNQNRKYSTMKYDGSDDPDSFQKYLGYDYERRSPNVSKMVDATAGEVIYHNNILIKPWYFSRSGGRTLSYFDYCQKNNWKNCENISYLQSVADPGGLGESRSGHGVGISGIGATHFARNGWDYKQIIQYYLSGVEIRK